MKSMQIHMNIRSTLGTMIVFLKDWVWYLISIVIASNLRGTAPLTKNQHVLCSISKLSTPFLKMMYAPYTKLSKKLKNGIEIEVGEAVLELIKTLFGLFWSITLKKNAWPPKISMPFLSSLDNLYALFFEKIWR